MMPKAKPPPPPAAAPSSRLAMGRLTRLPPAARPVVPLTGMTLVRGRFGFGPGEAKPAVPIPDVLVWLDVKQKRL